MSRETRYFARCDKCGIGEDTDGSCGYDGCDIYLPDGWGTRGERDLCPDCNATEPELQKPEPSEPTELDLARQAASEHISRLIYSSMVPNENVPKGMMWMLPKEFKNGPTED